MKTDPAVLGRTHFSDPLAGSHLAIAMAALPLAAQLALVCVGTDRSTGDSLGPFIGTNLVKQQAEGGFPAHVGVYGTLHDPVHALNLAEVAAQIETERPEATIIAIDACLGRARNIGYISLKRGPLQPGTGVNKQLPAIGHYHIIGVVNVAGFMEHVVLQNTRLSLVIQMAEVIAAGLTLCLGAYQPSVEAALGQAQRV